MKHKVLLTALFGIVTIGNCLGGNSCSVILDDDNQSKSKKKPHLLDIDPNSYSDFLNLGKSRKFKMPKKSSSGVHKVRLISMNTWLADIKKSKKDTGAMVTDIYDAIKGIKMLGDFVFVADPKAFINELKLNYSDSFGLVGVYDPSHFGSCLMKHWESHSLFKSDMCKNFAQENSTDISKLLTGKISPFIR